MANVKWIKLTTNLFDDEKVLMIESLPSADSIIVVWFKLLCLAGKMNNDGVFLMNNRIPYTDEMLAAIFRRDIKIVRMALETFQQFGMIEIIDNVITIPNWNKHQTLDAYEKKKERDRQYQQARRAKQRLLIEKSSDKSVDSKTTPSSYVAVSDKELELEKEINNINIINYNTSASDEADVKKAPKKQKESKRKHGEYQHVLLTDSEFESLAEFFGADLRDRAIKFLDEYIEEKGYKSKSHNLAIRRWVIDAVSKEKPQRKPQKRSGSFDTDDFFEAAVMRAWEEKEPPKLVSESEELKARAEALKERIGAETS